MNHYDNLGKAFIKYVSLNVLGMIGLSCYILADTFFVAKGLGSNGLAALNLVIPVFSLIYAIGLMLGMGSATKFGILSAMKEEKKANQYFSQAVIVIAVISLLFIIAGIFFAGPISTLCGAKGETYPLAEEYLKTILCFTPMFCFNHLFICFVRNDGNPKLAMLATLIGSLVNIVFDYIFIFPCNLGMLGAALATAMSPTVGILLLSSHMIKKKNHFHFQKTAFQFSVMLDTLKIGFSSFVNEMSNGIVILIFNYIILGIEGNIGVAAYGVVANIALVITSLFTGIGQGIQPLVSYYYGTGAKEKLTKTYRYGVITALCVAAVSYVVIVLFRKPLIMAFNEERNQVLASIANVGMILYFIGFLPSGFNVVSTFYMTAKEQAGKGMAISIARGFFCIVFFAVVLSRLFGMTGVWLSFLCAEAVTVLFAACLMKKPAVLEKEMH